LWLAVLGIVCAAVVLTSDHERYQTSPEVPAYYAKELVGVTPYRCADGWPSHSIGHRGACSHHGGVVGGNAIYKSVLKPAQPAVYATRTTPWPAVRHGFWALVVGVAGAGALWVAVFAPRLDRIR